VKTTDTQVHIAGIDCRPDSGAFRNYLTPQLVFHYQVFMLIFDSQKPAVAVPEIVQLGTGGLAAVLYSYVPWLL